MEAGRALVAGSHADESVVGIALAASSVVVMPWLGRAKRAGRIGSRIGSPATASEGKQNLLGAYLAGGLLVGLLGNALLGLWWLDPAVAPLIARRPRGRTRGMARRRRLDSWPFLRKRLPQPGYTSRGQNPRRAIAFSADCGRSSADAARGSAISSCAKQYRSRRSRFKSRRSPLWKPLVEWSCAEVGLLCRSTERLPIGRPSR